MPNITIKHTLPGFYNTFKAVPMKSFKQKGVLGVVAVGVVMDWGSDDEAVELFSEDIVTGASLKKIGYTINDTEEILPYMLSLISAYKGYFYKLNKGGNKSSYTNGDVTFTAKYTGIKGDKIGITVVSGSPSTGSYTLKVLVDNIEKEVFVISSLAEFASVKSDWIDVSTTETPASISDVSNHLLSGGSNGAVSSTSSDGVKATVDIGSLTFTAKNVGTDGNKIGITIIEDTLTSQYELKVLVDDVEKEDFTGLADTSAFLGVASSYVNITNPSGTTITEATNTKLVGGTNAVTSSYDSFFRAIKYKEFNVVAIMSEDTTVSDKVIAFVNNLRDVKNKYVQGVVYNKPSLNNYRITSVENGLECDEFTVTKELNVLLTASMKAGCPLNESLTDKNMTELVGARKIIGALNDDDDTELENAIAQGRFVYKYENDGTVRVLQDINTLVTFTDNEPKGYRKNRHIAIIDYLVNEEHRMAHSGMIGKYSNTEEKRNLCKSRFLDAYVELYDMGAIKEYDALIDMIVNIGEESDIVDVEQLVKPTDSIEIFNVTTNVDLNV